MLTFVPTPIGNLNDISKRSILAFEKADTVLCEDTRIAKKLFNLLEIPYGDKQFLSLHSHNESFRIEQLEPNLFIKEVIYMSDAGMPGISDPGAKLIHYCQVNAIEYDVIPGANALLTALVASGFEGDFTFFGFLPHKGNERESRLKEVLSSCVTAILYESPHRIQKLLQELQTLSPKRELFFAKELTKLHQTYIKGKSEEITLPNTKGEWVVILKGVPNKKKSILLEYDDILALSLPVKEKAKLLAKISDENPKEIYNRLVNL